MSEEMLKGKCLQGGPTSESSSLLWTADKRWQWRTMSAAVKPVPQQFRGCMSDQYVLASSSKLGLLFFSLGEGRPSALTLSPYLVHLASCSDTNHLTALCRGCTDTDHLIALCRGCTDTDHLIALCRGSTDTDHLTPLCRGWTDSHWAHVNKYSCFSQYSASILHVHLPQLKVNVKQHLSLCHLFTATKVRPD